MKEEREDWLTPATRIFSAQSLSRYSRFVGGMKLLLPALAVGIVLVLMIWPSPPSAPPPRKATALDSTMQKPAYTSHDEKGQPYKVEADVARQNPQAPGITDLSNPKGTIELQGGSTIQGQAEGAQYDQKAGKLLINGDLTLKHSSGAVFQTQRATVDMNSKSASGDAPVKVTGSFGEVDAQGFQLLDEGKVVIFTGHSTAHLKLGGGQNPAEAVQDLVPASGPAPKSKPPSSGL